MYHLHRGSWRGLACSVILLCLLPAVHAAEVEDSLKVVSGTNKSAVASQEKIDALSRETQELLDEYRKLQDGNDYQEAYTRELEELDRTQTEQIADLEAQIAQASITRQRILPLMRSMADALEKFVVLDLPFHHEERITAVLQLKQRLNQPELSVSARFRLLLEAYQLEQDYGDRIEAWRGPLQFQGEELSVQFLRIGRMALYFQSLDGETSGFWDRNSETWELLDSRYNRPLVQALRVAGNQSAPQLLQLPVMVPGGGS
jgi:hypothetical protein